MLESIFELYNFYKIPIDTQNTIIKNLIDQKDFKVSKLYITQLEKEVQIGRINHYLQNAIKASLKPNRIQLKKKVSVASESDSSLSDDDILVV